MDFEAPVTTARISGKRRYTKPWLTKGIEAASKKSCQLLKKTLSKIVLKKWMNTKNTGICLIDYTKQPGHSIILPSVKNIRLIQIVKTDQ